jgi:hypothetical protein
VICPQIKPNIESHEMEKKAMLLLQNSSTVTNSNDREVSEVLSKNSKDYKNDYQIQRDCE